MTNTILSNTVVMAPPNVATTLKMATKALALLEQQRICGDAAGHSR